MGYILVDTKKHKFFKIWYVVPGFWGGKVLLDQFKYNNTAEYLEALELAVNRSRKWAFKYKIDIGWNSNYDFNMSWQFDKETRNV